MREEKTRQSKKRFPLLYYWTSDGALQCQDYDLSTQLLTFQSNVNTSNWFLRRRFPFISNSRLNQLSSRVQSLIEALLVKEPHQMFVDFKNIAQETKKKVLEKTR